MARRSPFSVFMLWTTVAILAVWLLWAALDPLIAGRVFYTFRAFGLVSPLVALVCLALSVAAFAEAASAAPRLGRRWRRFCSAS
jgi:membrane-bound metal-dependent hydrolase YbcI (DUF457 family)